ncbi:hypothetical protein XENORESO_020530 [Xenotaenia resolanae]|uniref:Uncharacterized protein n=1 Tax=Xenotaenia resolanae TaxID=208358 RepID=A0ABV0W2B5_9TELE
MQGSNILYRANYEIKTSTRLLLGVRVGSLSMLNVVINGSCSSKNVSLTVTRSAWLKSDHRQRLYCLHRINSLEAVLLLPSTSCKTPAPLSVTTAPQHDATNTMLESCYSVLRFKCRN